MNVRSRRILRGLIAACFGAFLIWVANAFAAYPLGILRPPSEPIDHGRYNSEAERQADAARQRQEEEANKWKVAPNTSGITFECYRADMRYAVWHYRGIGMVLGLGMIALLIGCTLMVWGVLTSPKRRVRRSLPGRLERVSDKVERWDKTVPVEPDAISRPNSSDIQ
jgi:hypothetical protein